MYQVHSEKIVAQHAVDALRSALGERLIAVVLFGSRARGDARDTSDWDLLVLADGLPERAFARRLFLKQALPPEHRSMISILARSRQEFVGHLSALYLDIALDGQILYDPSGYAAEYMDSLRRLIEGAGLYREHTPAGDVWRWQKAPPGPWSLEWEKAAHASD